MLSIGGRRERYCDGISRREFLTAGALGMGGIGLPDLLRLRAEAGTSTGSANKSVIMVCLNGGPSHIDMYDMKPLAPVEFRGEFRPVPTNVPGFELCELMPRQARIADKLAVVRSLKMIQPNHQLHECYTGYPTDMHRPSFGSIVSAARDRRAVLPPYVSLSLSDHPRTVAKAERPTYLGLAHAPFEPTPSSLENLSRHADVSAGRFSRRKNLLEELDTLRRDLDTGGVMEGRDAFTAQALEMITSPEVRSAFDVSREPRHVRELYGGDLKSSFAYQFGHTWRGESFLRARRLVEAGVPVVTLAPGAWDHHGYRQGSIFARHRERLPMLDRSLHALVTDLDQRGLSRDVLVVMWGEFGRTPRVNPGAGRDHWTAASFALISGGGLPMGQVIGRTDAHAARITSKPYAAQDVLAVIYRHLGIDTSRTFPNFAGRPTYILEAREPIPELV